MLFYNDHIPDLELCKIDNIGNEEDIDANVQNTRNEYATKMLLLFFPFRDRSDFPIFKERWTFFCDAKNNGLLFWDATRIMQNIQDVENSKKILPRKDDMMLSTVDTNLDLGLERFRNGDVDDDESSELNMEHNDKNQGLDDENLDLIME